MYRCTSPLYNFHASTFRRKYGDLSVEAFTVVRHEALKRTDLD
jgi:hypothetical protein